MTKRQIRRSRVATHALARALEAPAAALRQDMGGGWRLKGRHRHCSPDPTGGYQCHVYSPWRWARCRRALRVMRMAADSHSEGVIGLNRLPGPVEASLIRAVLGVDHRLARPPQPELGRRMNLATKGERKMMIAPHRVQLRRTKGWRMPPDTVKVDRSTRWGNPFQVGGDGDRTECVARFARLIAGECASEAELAWRARALAHRGELKGRNLACGCALPRDGERDLCHAAVLLRFACAA